MMAPNTLKWVLTASLTANLLLGGFFIGEALHHRPPYGLPDMRQPTDPAVRDVVADLEQRRKESFKAMDEKREELGEILEEETFDAQAFLQKFKEMDATSTASKAAAVQHIVDTATKLSRSQRKELAEYLHHQRGPRCGHGGGPDKR